MAAMSDVPVELRDGFDALERSIDALLAERDDLLAALRGIVDIGKRDLSNPKYDGYFDAAREAIARARKTR